jgi:asparagine synthase (glutamine-hydrolysing)
MKQDQMSMATSIESRVPLLDHTLVEFAARVPASLKLRGRNGKYIFKSAVEDLLPNEIVNRPKMGFPTPLRDWLSPAAAGPLLDALEDRDGLLASITDRTALQALLARHRRGEIDGTDRVWRLLNLQIWGDLFLTGRGAARWESILGAPVSLSA